MEELTILVEPQEEGRTVRQLALGRLHMSSSQLKRAKFDGEILLDGQPIHSNKRVQAGQRLTLRIPPKAAYPLTPHPLPLTLPYQDQHLLVVDKPAPLPSAPSREKDTPTLANALYAHLGCPEGFVYRPVNRLDKGTSGLMAVALTAHAQQRLQGMLHTDQYLREYLAICQGRPPQEEGLICQPIAKAPGPTIRRQVSPTGKEAMTRYQLLETRGGLSLMRLRLLTGRTHQCRVHMQWLGCPLMGDFLYGQESPALPERFALHSYRLCLHHPITGEAIALESPLPPALEGLWREGGK